MTTLGDKIRAMKLGTWGNAWHFLDKAAALADEHGATIASAHEAAAQEAEKRGAVTSADAIRAMTDADAAAAMDRIKAEARREGMREAYELCKGVRRGAETDDYGIGALDCAIAILAAAEKEAGNG